MVFIVCEYSKERNDWLDVKTCKFFALTMIRDLFLLILIFNQYPFVLSSARSRSPRSTKVRQDALICEFIIRSLPLSQHYPFPISFNALTPRSEQIMDWLFTQCILRYNNLLEQHRNNVEQSVLGISTSDFHFQNTTAETERNLIVCIHKYVFTCHQNIIK